MDKTTGAGLALMLIVTGCAAPLLDRRSAQDISPRSAVVAANEVRAMEEAWVVAWRARDYPFFERTLAPEFVLASAARPDGTGIIPRNAWLRNWQTAVRTPYEARVLDVVVSGDTAVATIEARWTRESFITDTWVKRNGRWQMIFRHSSPRRSTEIAPATLP